MDALKLAMQSAKSHQAFIEVTVAREQDENNVVSGAHLISGSLEALNAADQERPIEATPDEEPTEVPQQGPSETDGGFPKKESK